MKPLMMALSLIILILLTVIVMGVIELKKEDQLKQATINGLQKQLDSERDSTAREMKLTQERFSKQMDSLKTAHQETINANKVSQKEIRTLRSILFVRFENDSLRLVELKRLYPSWK